MTIHPWTNYELARMHDEDRLQLAREAMRALELRDQDSTETKTSWLVRLRRRELTTHPAPTRSRPA